MQDKLDPGKENRTFETRLEFINNIFSQPHSKEEIMASSIQFKLNKTYEQYVEEVERSLNYLLSKDAEKVLNKIK